MFCCKHILLYSINYFLVKDLEITLAKVSVGVTGENWNRSIYEVFADHHLTFLNVRFVYFYEEKNVFFSSVRKACANESNQNMSKGEQENTHPVYYKVVVAKP